MNDDMPDRLSHLDERGQARMVDVGHRPVQLRIAVAAGEVSMNAATLRAITEGVVPKGDVLATARIAGIMAAKRCGELIPLCHPLPIESAEVAFEIPTIDGDRVRIGISSTVRITAKTGVEMEALTAVSVAALTIYDMCKAVDKTIVIENIRVLSKSKQ